MVLKLEDKNNVILSRDYTWQAGKISQKSCGWKCAKFSALKTNGYSFCDKNVSAFLEYFLIVKWLADRNLKDPVVSYSNLNLNFKAFSHGPQLKSKTFHKEQYDFQAIK